MFNKVLQELVIDPRLLADVFESDILWNIFVDEMSVDYFCAQAFTTKQCDSNEGRKSLSEKENDNDIGLHRPVSRAEGFGHQPFRRTRHSTHSNFGNYSEHIVDHFISKLKVKHLAAA